MASLAVPNRTIHRLDGIVLRSPGGMRAQPDAVQVSIEGGLHGDRWVDGKANPTNQISMMNVNIAHAIANGQSVVLFGDNLFTDHDLSEDGIAGGCQISGRGSSVAGEPTARSMWAFSGTVW